MLNKTTELGIQTLLFVALYGEDKPVPPHHIAERIGASADYLRKVSRLLVKAGFFRAHRGAHGGVVLQMPPSQITLLAVLEACQGKVLPDYCEGVLDPKDICYFHHAMLDLHGAITGVLEKWTLADLMKQPVPTGVSAEDLSCRMGAVCGKKIAKHHES